jgi:hypothetical protein
MKIFMKYVTCLAVLVVASCHNRNIVEMNELPPDIITSKPCPTLFSVINQLFPEAKDGTLNQTALFDAGATKRLVLKQESDVYITFISEGAAYTNTVGYYTYDQNSPPSSRGSLTLNIVFPNVSMPPLKTGDRVRLGDKKFAAGTVIGFFIIERGWANGTVDFDNTTHFTDFKLNINQAQQHVLFMERKCGDIVLAFEDIALSNTSDPHYDKDYNDIIFSVSDNNEELNVSRIDTTSMVTLHN